MELKIYIVRVFSVSKRNNVDKRSHILPLENSQAPHLHPTIFLPNIALPKSIQK
jgi:hypothetical protein